MAGDDSGSVALETGAVGPASASASAVDRAGNRGSASCDYRVVYAFGGFERPIGDGVNVVKAGSAVPVRFTLGGDVGRDVLAPGSPFAGELHGDGGRYQFVWKTSKAWAGTTRTLSVTLADGTTHTADFRFR
jgi:hypothetical protein